MKFSDLHIFREVAQRGSISHAALSLDLSQPNVSRVIRTLEKRLNTTLLRRTGRGVELTPTGQRWLEFANRLNTEFETVKSDIQKMDGGLPDQIRIFVPRNTGRLLVPAIFRTFHEHLPDLQLDIVERQAIDSSKALLSRACGAAVYYDNATSQFPQPRGLFEEPLFMTGHEVHLGKSSEPITLEDCSRLPLLMFSNPPYASMIERAFADQNLRPNITRRLENKVAMMAFAIEGEGVAIQAFSNFVNEFENGEIQARLIIEPGVRRNILAAVGMHLEPAFAETVHRLLKSALNDIADSARWTSLPGKGVANHGLAGHDQSHAQRTSVT